MAVVRAWAEKSPRDRKVAVVNNEFRTAPWADVLYAGDAQWWRAYGAEVERDFRGELWCGDPSVEWVNTVQTVDLPGLSTRADRVYHGGNSGYQLINLVALWGVARIVLLGYDMQPGPRGERHHYGRHRGLPNPASDMREWAPRMIQLGVDLRAHGVRVVNASRRTAIKCFERTSIQLALRNVSASLEIPQELVPKEHAAFKEGLHAAGYTGGSDLSILWGSRASRPLPERTLIAENGYYSPPGMPYCALALGGHNGAGAAPAGSKERFEQLGIALRAWRTKGGHVLVCPSRGIGLNPQPKGWTERAVARLRELTDREIRVRKHPGNWKLLAEHPDASLRADLVGAWACVIWASSAGVRSLIQGVPVIYTAPHWILAEAAGPRLEDIEAPLMPDRLPAFYRLASAQWSLDEIATGEPLLALEMVQHERKRIAA